MEELKSSLPFDEVKEALRQNTVTITSVSLSDYKMRKVLTNIDRGDEPLSVSLYTMDNEKVRGYMPSKVWWDGGINMLYYTSPTMPVAARPFGDAPVYCFTTSLTGQDITYDANWRVFIDQIITPTGVLLMVMFDEETYRDIIHKEL
jgi:hypothetical protein